MEFPDLGSHCFEKTCNRLDFLPMKCDACSNIFCKDHFQYNQHSCTNAYHKDVQVPVCPLCNHPVPSKRGEQPDIAVSEHIDRDCQADPALSKRKIYTNRCGVKGCKQKEIIKVTCDVCHKNYCLKHRHPVDHKCDEVRLSPAKAAGAAAIARAQNKKTSVFPKLSNNWISGLNKKQNKVISPNSNGITSIQAGMSEDEALALALHQSLNETKPKNIQEEEDRLLAQALANCEMNQNPSVQNQQNRNKNCCLS